MKSKLELLNTTPGGARHSKEPARTTAGKVTAIVVILSSLDFIFPNLIPENWQVTIFALASLLIPLITGLLIRRKVWSPASVLEATEEAVDAYKEYQKMNKNTLIRNSKFGSKPSISSVPPETEETKDL